MKKSLFALAAVTAFAGAAQAQSSVTVYGLMDIGVGGYGSRAAGVTSTTVGGGQAGGGVNKTTGTVAIDGAESTNRLGFKGTEDLGGGASAFFTIELGLNPDSQSTLSTASSNSTENRQTFVGLKKNGLGDLALGTQYTTVYNAVAKTDAGNTNNLTGDLIYTAGKGSGVYPQGNAAGDSFTIRANQMITLNSETYAGFQAHAMAILNNNNSTQSTTTSGSSTTVVGGINNQNGWGLGLDYTWNKLFLTANYQGLTAKNPSVTVTNPSGLITSQPSGAPVPFGAVQSSQLGTNVQDNQFYVGGTYDFGILKAYAQYVTRKVMLQQDNNQYAKRSAEQIGIRSFITPTIEGWVSGGLGRVTGNGGTFATGYAQPTANLTAWQIGSNYWLSKRTNLYAIYGQSNTSNVSNVSTAGANGNPVSGNINNYAVGVRHTF